MTTDDEQFTSRQAAEPSVTISADEKHAQVSIAGSTGHHSPGERTAVAGKALDDERVAGAEQVTVAAPRGDTEVLEEVRSRLDPHDVRQVGATILIQGRHRDRPPVDLGEDPAQEPAERPGHQSATDGSPPAD
ncbi:MAG: hypothetical protein WCF36_20635 [Candidatus Nanopelagicales bacterium]